MWLSVTIFFKAIFCRWVKHGGLFTVIIIIFKSVEAACCCRTYSRNDGVSLMPKRATALGFKFVPTLAGTQYGIHDQKTFLRVGAFLICERTERDQRLP